MGQAGNVTFSLDQYLPSYLEGGYTKEEFKDDIRSLKLRGQRVLLSVGGQDIASTRIIVKTDSAAQQFSNSVKGIIKEYGFDGVDLNIEISASVEEKYKSSSEHLIKALKTLYEDPEVGGESFILTMAPQTVDFKNTRYQIIGLYYEILQEVKDFTAIVNMQLYNSGSQWGQDNKEYFPSTVDFITGVLAIMLENGLKPEQVGLGTHYDAENKGGSTPELVIKGFSALVNGEKPEGGTYTPIKAYPRLGGIMIWSVNGEAKSNYRFLNAFSTYRNK